MGMLGIFTLLFLGLTLYLYQASRALFSSALQRELDGDINWVADILARDAALSADPRRADSLMKSISRHKDFRITLTDGEGRVLADSHVPRDSVAHLENHRRRPEFQAARAQGRGHAWRYSATLGQEMLYVARRLGDGSRYLRMAAGPGPLETFQRAAGLIFTLFLALFAVSAMVITWWMSRTISTPLLHLAEHPGATPRWQAPFREAEVLNGAFERYVTEVRQLAGEVSLERDRLMAVLNRLEEGILILTLDGLDIVITAANPASLRLLGIDPGTLVAGRRVGEVVRPEALLRWLARAADPERTPVLHLDRGPDLPYDLLCRLGPLGLPSRPDASPGAAGMGPTEFVLTLVDITEFRHLDQVKSEFVANASHELKTPLSSLKGYAETLLEGALDNDKVRRPFVEKIQANALRLERLVQDLLHLSQLEANPVPREQEPLPLRNYVSAAAALHKHGIDSAGLRFENHVPENLRVMMEPRDLELILNNLVGNAVRYNKAGGKIKVGMVDGALYVKDTGVGIPEAMLPRIFERFYRADASRARKDGTGLGLAIVKHAAHKYGMAVRAESTLGEGSRFLVDIPEGVLKPGPVKA